MTGIKAKIDEAKSERKTNRRAPTYAPAGQSTQMIIGATPTTDRVILDRATSLYRKQRLRRVYYSAFSPIPSASRDLPLIAPPLLREHRLYQADWLIRFYGFQPTDLTSEAAPSLDLTIDPKLAWAVRNPAQFPIDLNRATREQLLRVPGLGVRNVDRILTIRRWSKITLADLTRLRAPVKKMLPFIETTDHYPKILGELSDLVKPKPQQLSFTL
jgi:predicted DNA-binding helix-hairpin-helix protein